MDADCFDAFARSLSGTALGSRRRLLRGLLSGMVGLIAAGLGRTEGRAGNEAGIIDRPPPRRRRRRPKRRRWTAQRCPKRPLQRCLKPAERKFLRAIEPCRRPCEADPKGSACTACIRPHAVALANAGRDCTDRLCRGGSAVTTSAAAPTAMHAAASGELRSAALRSCQSQQLKVCQNRAERNYVICLVAAGAACVGSAGLGCAAGIIGCGVLYATSASDCNEDFGCSPGICLPSNVCCPTGFHTPCGDTCCPSGQLCDAGTCKCPGGVLACGTTCCHASAVGCAGNRCLNQCDLDGDCGG